LERFKSLQALNKTSRSANLKETKAETQRFSTDPQLLSQLERKRATAAHKLLKDETPDFERKRAWDWTAEESEKWDKRLEKKARNRENVAFADYRTDANKAYKRQLKNLGVAESEARARYEEEKQRAIQKAAERGGLELVETEDGELIAVDKDGAFYSTADSTDFVTNKPDKEAVDRLVNDIRKAEEARLKERRKRGIKDEDDSGDVTYINQKNKQFNEKLARFYNKYTTDIRESFERGTAI
jgi:pre-mRNA-splicing factor SYF2